MVNKSDKPVNGGQPPKRMKEMFEERDYNVSYEHLSTKDSAPKFAERLDALQKLQGLHQPNTTDYNTITENIGYTEDDLANEISRLEKVYTPKYNESLASSVETYTKMSNINSRTTTMSGMSKYHRQAQSHKNRFLPTEMIEGRNQALMEEANVLGSSIASQARGLSVGEDTAALQQRSARISSIEDEIALNKRLLKVQARQGYSTEKLVNRGEDLDRDVNEFIKRRGIESRVTSGNVGNFDDEMKKLGHIKENRNSLQDQYNDAIEKGSEMAAIFAEKLAKANDALEDQTRVVKTMASKGMDGAGGGGFFTKYSGHMQLGAMGLQALSSAASLANTIVGDQDIAQMNNRASFARMGNAIYGKANEAIYNNSIDAALDVLGSDTGAAAYAARNKSLRNATAMTAGVANLGSDLLSNSATYAAMGAAAGTIVPVLGTAAGAGVGLGIGIVKTLADGTPAITNTLYGNEGADASIRSYEAYKSLSAEERKIRAAQMQTFYNQGLTSYNTTIGLGNTASAQMQNSLMDVGTLNNLAGVGIGASRAAQLTSLLSQGGNLRGQGMNILTAAGAAAQRGQMSAEEYTSAAARMVSMGGSNEDLQKIIEAATAKGMDNSKAINDIASSSMQMSAGLANIGVSAVGTTSNMLSAGAQSMVGIGVDPNLATGAAAASMNKYNGLISDQNFNLGNIMERAELRTGRFKDATKFQMDSLASMSAEEHQIFRDAASGDPEAAKQAQLLARRKGITGLVYKNGQIDTAAISSLSKASMRGMLINTGAADAVTGIMNKINSGKELSDEDRAVLNSAGVDESTLNIASGNFTVARKKGTAGRRGQERDMLAASREAHEFAQGQVEAGKMGPGDAWQNIEKMMSAVNAAVDPSKFGEVVAKGAEKFEVPVAKFDKAVAEFRKAVDRQNELLGKMGEGRNYGTIPSKDK